MTTTTAPVQLLTTSDLRRLLGLTERQLAYVVSKEGIRPLAIAGGVRVYDGAAIDRIRQARAVIDEKRRKAAAAQ